RTESWEIGRIGFSRYRGIALSVYRDAISDVVAPATETIRVRQRGTVRRKLRHEDVRILIPQAAGGAGHVGRTHGIDRDGVRANRRFITREIRRVHQLGSVRT